MKTLILGHSQVKYFHEYVSSEDIKCISDSGCLIGNLLDVPGASDEIKSKQLVVIVCGINNIPRNSNDDVVQKFKTLVESIRKLNSRAKIILSTILPRELNWRVDGVHYSRSELLVINKNITKINEELKDYSRTMDSVYIVEHPQFVSSLGVTNESLLAEDGLHLSFEGTEVTVQNIESAIMEVCRDSFSIITSSAMNETPVTSEVVRDPLNADKLFFSDVVRLGDVKVQPRLKTTTTNQQKTQPPRKKTRECDAFVRSNKTYVIRKTKSKPPVLESPHRGNSGTYPQHMI